MFDHTCFNFFYIRLIICSDDVAAEDSSDDEKTGRKSPCQTAVGDDSDDSQTFHSSRPLNRRSLSLVGAVNGFSLA